MKEVDANTGGDQDLQTLVRQVMTTLIAVEQISSIIEGKLWLLVCHSTSKTRPVLTLSHPLS